MRTIRRLRLRCFSFNIFSDELSTYRLVTLSNLGQAHQKRTTRLPIVKRGVVPFWWTWGDSHPRLEFLRVEGITTILFVFNHILPSRLCFEITTPNTIYIASATTTSCWLLWLRIHTNLLYVYLYTTAITMLPLL